MLNYVVRRSCCRSVKDIRGDRRASRFVAERVEDKGLPPMGSRSKLRTSGPLSQVSWRSSLKRDKGTMPAIEQGASGGLKAPRLTAQNGGFSRENLVKSSGQRPPRPVRAKTVSHAGAALMIAMKARMFVTPVDKDLGLKVGPTALADDNCDERSKTTSLTRRSGAPVQSLLVAAP